MKVSFLYPLKTLVNLWFPGVFRGLRRETCITFIGVLHRFHKISKILKNEVEEKLAHIFCHIWGLRLKVLMDVGGMKTKGNK